jgi:hypothetical protein
MTLFAVYLRVLTNQRHFGCVVIKGEACFVKLPPFRCMTGAAADIKIKPMG